MNNYRNQLEPSIENGRKFLQSAYFLLFFQSQSQQESNPKFSSTLQNCNHSISQNNEFSQKIALNTPSQPNSNQSESFFQKKMKVIFFFQFHKS